MLLKFGLIFMKNFVCGLACEFLSSNHLDVVVEKMIRVCALY